MSIIKGMFSGLFCSPNNYLLIIVVIEIEFSCMFNLSVGTIHFEDGFCGSRMGGEEGGGEVGAPLWVTVHGGCCNWL